MQDLGTLGGDWSVAVAINESGLVIGVSNTEAAERLAFLWDAIAGMRDLGTLGGDWSEPIAINNPGQVVGLSSTAAGEWPRHAFLWTAEDGMRDQGYPTGSELDYWRPEDINDSGQVVGNLVRVAGYRAYLWDEAHGFRHLDDLGHDASSAWDINNQGQIVGSSKTPAGDSHAVLWDPTQGMVDAGLFGGDWSEAIAINERGQLIGTVGVRHYTPFLTYSELYPFLWQE